MAEPTQRDIAVQGLVYGIRATPSADDKWRAAVYALARTNDAGDAVALLGDNPLDIFGGGWSETGPDAEAAIDALSQRISRAVSVALTDAKQTRLDDANRRHQEHSARMRPSREG